MEATLRKLRRDYPKLSFKAGSLFCWSPKDNTISYKPNPEVEEVATWSLLHEVGHALLKHKNYRSDFELLRMEAEAWQKATSLGHAYQIRVDEEHVQDCLDTYRDWLHKRSTCPTCGTHTFQKNNSSYSCFNCGTEWHVSSSRVCRPYRRLAQIKNRPLEKDGF